jgi:hypothetical protein
MFPAMTFSPVLDHPDEGKFLQSPYGQQTPCKQPAFSGGKGGVGGRETRAGSNPTFGTVIDRLSSNL